MPFQNRVVALLALLLAGTMSGTVHAQNSPYDMDRTVLPIQEPARAAITEVDARNVPLPPRFEVKAPKGAPNVVIVLIDDMGFGVPSSFGGPVSMPSFETRQRHRARLLPIPTMTTELAWENSELSTATFRSPVSFMILSRQALVDAPPARSVGCAVSLSTRAGTTSASAFAHWTGGCDIGGDRSGIRSIRPVSRSQSLASCPRFYCSSL